MRNVWIIFRKELRSYFVSPIAYLLLAMFAVIFGFFFWNILGFFIREGTEAMMSGQMFPMNLNERVIRPLLSNISVVGLFLIPMITMRLFAEEKRTGTIELLATSPVSDLQVILGKWSAAVVLYGGMLLLSAVNFVFLFKYGRPDWKPLAIGYLGLLLQAGALLAIGTKADKLAVLGSGNGEPAVLAPLQPCGAIHGNCRLALSRSVEQIELPVPAGNQ